MTATQQLFTHPVPYTNSAQRHQRILDAHYRLPTMIRVLLLAVFLYCATMIITAVPIQVDEAIQYHPIACDFYNNAKYNTFWHPCDSSARLNLSGIQLKRAYGYVGSLSSYFYYPFFR